MVLKSFLNFLRLHKLFGLYQLHFLTCFMFIFSLGPTVSSSCSSLSDRFIKICHKENKKYKFLANKFSNQLNKINERFSAFLFGMIIRRFLTLFYNFPSHLEWLMSAFLTYLPAVRFNLKTQTFAVLNSSCSLLRIQQQRKVTWNMQQSV